MLRNINGVPERCDDASSIFEHLYFSGRNFFPVPLISW